MTPDEIKDEIAMKQKDIEALARHFFPHLTLVCGVQCILAILRCRRK